MQLSPGQKRFSGLARKFYAGFRLFAVIFSLALTIYAERLPVKTYTVADGLLRDMVSRIKQDSRGFLWFCTAEGVSHIKHF